MNYNNMIFCFSYNFETDLPEDGSVGLRYTYKMVEGVTPAEQYGLRLAHMMGFPGSILESAADMAQRLLANRKVSC